MDDSDLRRYNEVLIVEGRKNGKTTETAAIELDLLVNDGEGSRRSTTWPPSWTRPAWAMRRR